METEVAPNADFTSLASRERLERVAMALETNGIRAVAVETAADAKRAVLEMLPQGAEVFSGQSRTLDELELRDEIDTSGHYDAVGPKLAAMDRATQGDEMRRMRSTPDVIVGSVQAITDRGQVVVASNTGSQLAPYAGGAKRVIWVVGAQKIVKDLDEAFRRVYEHSLPLESARLGALYPGMKSNVSKLLVVNREVAPGRITAILVREKLGF